MALLSVRAVEVPGTMMPPPTRRRRTTTNTTPNTTDSGMDEEKKKIDRNDVKTEMGVRDEGDDDYNHDYDGNNNGRSPPTLPAVAAQVEILYETEQTLTADDDECGRRIRDAGGRLGTVPIASVAVFQGWIRGGGDVGGGDGVVDGDGGDGEGVRWRLALNRPAWEFPHLVGGTETGA